MTFIYSNISLPFTESEDAFCTIAKNKMKRAAGSAQFHFYLYKKSVDARRKDDIRFVCSVAAVANDSLSENQIRRIIAAGFKAVVPEEKTFVCGNETLQERPLVVGCGPAGMFCALALAERGYRPIVIDRGGSVQARATAYSKFCSERVLDTENNIQFGAGGAGTFSDGKLTTRINDPKCSYVLSKLVKFGAPKDILLKAKPHIGTDILQDVVCNLIKHIEDLGGEVILNCRLDSIKKNSDKTNTAHTSKGDIVCGCIVLATGHSARDTYSMLMSSGFELVAKPFSVGVRIEHLREDLDLATYGKFAGDPRLGAAEYNFSDTTGRGVYTFCMCPGGEVVAAATEHGGLVVNGMSRRSRDGKNSNSAIAVTVNREDYGSSVVGAIEYQRSLERRAFAAGGNDYSVPVQTVGDFLNGTFGTEPTKVQPSYMGGGSYRIANLSAEIPDYIASELKKGIISFSKKRQGFDDPCAVLSGFETRTSSPVRILRNESLTTDKDDLIYPCGEGAGYAGGITSAAVDGLRIAEKIISRFSAP